MEQNKETATQNKQREAEVCREKKQTALECGELTREEGLYLMVNTLADENHRLNQMCNDLIMRMPSRLHGETITGEK
jgi:hypothetical protein